MNAFPVSALSTFHFFLLTIPQPGTRVFFWTSNGDVEYAIVQSTNRLPDVRIPEFSISNLSLTDAALGNSNLGVKDRGERQNCHLAVSS
jgi:hypothetical protein